MATPIGDLVVRLGAQTRQFDQKMLRSRITLAKLGTVARGVGLSISGMFTGFAARGGPLVAGLAFIKLAASGETFNRKMLQSMAIMGDLTDVMKNDLRQAAIQTASVTKFSAAETAEAFFFLQSAGLKAEQAIVALPAVARFAQAGVFDLSTATQLLTDSMAALGLKSKDPLQNLANMIHLSDTLVKANTLADASTQQFAEALAGPVAGFMRAYSISLEEGVGLLALLAERGQKGLEASESAMVLFRDIPRAVAMNRDAFKKYGVTIDDGTGNMLGMADVVKNLTDSLSKMGSMTLAAALQEMGLTRSVRTVILKLFEGSKELRTFSEELKNVGGTTAEVSAKQLTSLQKGIAKFGAAFSAAGSSLMVWLGPRLGGVLEGMARKIRVIQAAFQALLPWMTGFFKSLMTVARTAIDFVSTSFGALGSNVTSTLDTMLGSWVGWGEGVLMIFRTIKNEFMQLHTGAKFSLAKFLLESIGADQDVLDVLEADRKRESRGISREGEAISEEWQRTLRRLPKLSERFKDALSKIPLVPTLLPDLPPFAPATRARGGDAGPGGTDRSVVAGTAAMLAGSREAFSTIASAMRQQTVKKAERQRQMLIAAVEQGNTHLANLVDQEPEVFAIP